MQPIRLLLGLAVVGALAAPRPAEAIPAFARKYGVSCQMCHDPVPRLNAAGEAFAANGFQFAPGEDPRDTVNTGDALLRLQNSLPLAVRFDAYMRTLTKRQRGQVSADFQAPWVMKVLSGGQVADNISYYVYFLLSERGEVGGLEDAYVQFTDVAGSGVDLILGQFQVSDPLFKREVRLEYEDYQPYRMRVGHVSSDLTYDRGVMALYSPWAGMDVALEVVSGKGLNAASGDREYDTDDPKNGVLRLSQEVGPLRLGAVGYYGVEKVEGRKDQVRVWGPDATIALGSAAEVNLQFLRRTDDDPFFGACPPGDVCQAQAAGVRTPTTVDAMFGEVIWHPQGPQGRFTVTALYNWIDADRPVVSLRLGEQDTPLGFLSRYETVTGGVHYLLRRNVRLLGEVTRDVEAKQFRLTAGVVTAF